MEPITINTHIDCSNNSKCSVRHSLGNQSRSLWKCLLQHFLLIITDFFHCTNVPIWCILTSIIENMSLQLCFSSCKCLLSIVITMLFIPSSTMILAIRPMSCFASIVFHWWASTGWFNTSVIVLHPAQKKRDKKDS